MIALTTEDPAARLLAMSRVLQPHERKQLLLEQFRQPGAEEEIAGVVRAHMAPVSLSPLGETLHLDTRLALVDNMLLYFDKMSMAASLEVRVPFMDHDVVAFCSRLPDSRRVWRLRRKELLRRASRGLVDDAIIDKPKRGFFHSALGAWLAVHQEGMVHETLRDGRTLARGQYDPDALTRLIAARRNKKASQILLAVLLLERWQRIFVDGDASYSSNGASPQGGPVGASGRLAHVEGRRTSRSSSSRTRGASVRSRRSTPCRPRSARSPSNGFSSTAAPPTARRMRSRRVFRA